MMAVLRREQQPPPVLMLLTGDAKSGIISPNVDDCHHPYADPWFYDLLPLSLG